MAQAEPTTPTLIDESLLLVQVDEGFGSGFLYGDARTVVTNRHVVEGLEPGDRVQLRQIETDARGWTDLGQDHQGIVRYLHPDLDLAVIELAGTMNGRPLDRWTMSGRDFAARGTQVLAHGFPSLGSPMISRGVICGHWMDPTTGERFYLTDAAIAEGSSGGPMTDEHGRLIGVTTGIYDLPEELGHDWGFVIPASQLDALFTDGVGVEHLPQRLDIDRLVGEFNQERDVGRRFGAGLEAIAAITREASSADELVEIYGRYINGIAGHLRIDTSEAARALMVFSVRSGAMLAGRLAAFAIRGDVLSPDAQWEANALGERLGVIAEREVGRMILTGTASDMEQLLLVICDVLAEIGEEAVTRELAGACQRLMVIDFDLSNPIRARGFQRDEVIDDLTGLVIAAVCVSLINETLAEWPTDREIQADVSPSGQRQLERIRSRLDVVVERWGELPESCRTMLIELTGGHGEGQSSDVLAIEQQVEAARAQFRTLGATLKERQVITVEPDGMASVAWEVRGVPVLGVLASTTHADIDLALLDPAREVMARDEEFDSWPIVVTWAPEEGSWLVYVFNASPVEAVVELEFWE